MPTPAPAAPLAPAHPAAPPDPAAFGRAHNFTAGPGALPLDVLLELRDEIPAYGVLGATIFEVSHRSDAYDAIDASAKRLLRELLGAGEEWHVLFLQGGATMQFHQVPLNFLRADASADYLNTGVWSAKAIEEARRFGRVNVAASSEDAAFSYIPDPAAWTLDANAAYLHYTSNNTIFGTEFHATPHAEVPLVCDASSDFLSRPLVLAPHGLVYAGAQKNLGPAGVTVVLVRESFLATRKPDVPPILDYGRHTGELFNTPPVFAVYLVEKVLRWLVRQGGVGAMDAAADRKSRALYDRIDRTDFYRGTVRPASRSRMNVCFRLPTETLEARFVRESEAAGLIGLKGHRLVGGLRASLYNAVPEASVAALVAFMDAFEAQHG